MKDDKRTKGEVLHDSQLHTQMSYATNPSILLKTYRQRMVLVTPTRGSSKSFLRHTYQPFILLFTIPAVTFTALQYGFLLAWLSVLATTEATYFAYPPYNFSSIGIGLLSLPAFIGATLGGVYGGPLSDWSIIYFTKRNNGIYEPEMRLYLSIFPALAGPAGLFLYGLSTAAVRMDILYHSKS